MHNFPKKGHKNTIALMEKPTLRSCLLSGRSERCLGVGNGSQIYAIMKQNRNG